MNADVEKAVEGVRTALNDWAITHAPEFCADDSVAAARKRTSDEGTLAYIGDALASMDAIKQALRDQDAMARDAERYRWLRQNADEIGWYGADSHYAFPGIRYADESHRPELDAAIDAAMRSAQEAGNE